MSLGVAIPLRPCKAAATQSGPLPGDNPHARRLHSWLLAPPDLPFRRLLTRRAFGRLRVASVTPDSPSYRWWVAGTVMLNVFTVMMNTATASLALPSIMTSLSMSLDEAQWIMTAYMIASAVLIPTVGWLGNVLGNRNLLLLSLVVFIIGSVLCGMAWSGSSLIAFRILQGMGGGPVMPMALMFVTQAFPPQRRGLAVGLYTLGISCAPVVGPVLGGYITEYIHWRMIFYVNLLPGLAGVLLVLLVLPQTREKVRRRLDAPGLIALATFLVSLLLALSLGRRYGWDSSFIQRSFVIAGVALVALVAIELNRKQPLVELRLLANPAFAAAMVAVLIHHHGLLCQYLPAGLHAAAHVRLYTGAGRTHHPARHLDGGRGDRVRGAPDRRDRPPSGHHRRTGPVCRGMLRLVLRQPAEPDELDRLDDRGALLYAGLCVRTHNRRHPGGAAAGAGAHGLGTGQSGSKRPGRRPGTGHDDDRAAEAHDVLQRHAGPGPGRPFTAVVRRGRARPPPSS